MELTALRAAVERALLTELARQGEFFVPVSSSNRHIHLSQSDADRLFGPGYSFEKLRNLVQSGQYACREQVVLETPKGRLTLRVLGPCRKETQAELSLTEAIGLGLEPVVRMSGDLSGTPGGTLLHGERRVILPRGIMVAARHLHMAPHQALAYGLKDGDRVSLVAEGVRPTAFGDVAVRVGEAHLLEAHLDRDETNAAALPGQGLCRLIKEGEPPSPRKKEPVLPAVPTAKLGKIQRALVTEEAVKAAHQEGQTVVLLDRKAIVTPLARDAALQYRIELRRTQGGDLP